MRMTFIIIIHSFITRLIFNFLQVAACVLFQYYYYSSQITRFEIEFHYVFCITRLKRSKAVARDLSIKLLSVYRFRLINRLNLGGLCLDRLIGPFPLIG